MWRAATVASKVEWDARTKKYVNEYLIAPSVYIGKGRTEHLDVLERGLPVEDI